MSSLSPSDEWQASHLDPAIETGVRLLRAIFDERDTVLFRPIETWTEGGKKHKSVIYSAANPARLSVALRQLVARAPEEHANIFFGVCPRRGDRGRFDQAWQIRTVRVLWCDIDHLTEEQALERVTKAGMPRPSIVVNSGTGVHLYWILEVPYAIDDVGAPLPVLTEWSDDCVCPGL
jgi:hypothetical protein